MRISTRARYGLRAMVDLGRQYGRGPASMGDIAERQGVSRKYLHALLSALQKARLVCGTRGVGGGFTLARPPNEIRLDEAVRVLEGPFSLTDCVSDENACERTDDCPTRRIWSEITAAIETVLRRHTLADLIVMERGKPNGKARKASGAAGTRRSRPTAARSSGGRKGG